MRGFFAGLNYAGTSEHRRLYKLRRKRLVSLYEQCNPDKLPEVDTLLQFYAGRESDLFAEIEERYGLDVAYKSPSERSNKPKFTSVYTEANDY